MQKHAQRLHLKEYLAATGRSAEEVEGMDMSPAGNVVAQYGDAQYQSSDLNAGVKRVYRTMASRSTHPRQREQEAGMLSRQLVKFFARMQLQPSLIYSSAVFELAKALKPDLDPADFSFQPNFYLHILDTYNMEKRAVWMRVLSAPGRISLSLQILKDPAQSTTFVAVVAHWIDSHWTRQHALLDMKQLEGAPTASNLNETFMDIMEGTLAASPRCLGVTVEDGSYTSTVPAWMLNAKSAREGYKRKAAAFNRQLEGFDGLLSGSGDLVQPGHVFGCFGQMLNSAVQSVLSLPAVSLALRKLQRAIELVQASPQAAHHYDSTCEALGVSNPGLLSGNAYSFASWLAVANTVGTALRQRQAMDVFLASMGGEKGGDAHAAGAVTTTATAAGAVAAGAAGAAAAANASAGADDGAGGGATAEADADVAGGDNKKPGGGDGEIGMKSEGKDKAADGSDNGVSSTDGATGEGSGGAGADADVVVAKAPKNQLKSTATGGVSPSPAPPPSPSPSHSASPSSAVLSTDDWATLQGLGLVLTAFRHVADLACTTPATGELCCLSHGRRFQVE